MIRSVETDLGRWTQVVAVINIEAYSFLAFWDLTCHLEDVMFSVCTMLPDNKETKFWSSDQEASPSVGKNTARVVSVPCAY